jgi:hypothetical protein
LVIHIDLIYVEENIKSEIIKYIEIEFPAYDDNLQEYFKLIYAEDDKRNGDSNKSHTVNGIILEEDEVQINKIKHQIKDFFINRAIGKYIIIQDEAVNNKLTVLNRSQGESAGIHQCRHCGMEFEDEIQFSTHLRMHFFI